MRQHQRWTWAFCCSIVFGSNTCLRWPSRVLRRRSPILRWKVQRSLAPKSNSQISCGAFIFLLVPAFREFVIAVVMLDGFERKLKHYFLHYKSTSNLIQVISFGISSSCGSSPSIIRESYHRNRWRSRYLSSLWKFCSRSTRFPRDWPASSMSSESDLWLVVAVAASIWFAVSSYPVALRVTLFSSKNIFSQVTSR